MNVITISFRHIIESMRENNLKLCFSKNGTMLLKDKNENLYTIEKSKHNSYLDNLIKNNTQVNFLKLENTDIETVNKYITAVWGTSEINDFMKRHSL